MIKKSNEHDLTSWERAYLSNMPHFVRPGSIIKNPTSKYKPTRYPDNIAGAFFSGVFSDHVVLQRGPRQAAVYGVVIGARSSTTVSVKITQIDASNKSYIVAGIVDITKIQTHSGLYARWKALLRATPAGGNYTITVSCASCNAPANSSTIRDVTFGDVWFCSGQSNMWLPMHMDTSRNITYDAVLAGRYKNIRMHSVPHNNQPDGGYNGTDLYISPPPPPRHAWGGDSGGGWLLPDVGTYANATCRAGGGDHGCQDPRHCCTGYNEPNDDWLFNSIDQFSATCWHFAEHLTDMAQRRNETVIPFGLISSQWGGTMVEHWIPNATLNAQACRNNSGGPYAPWQNKRWDIDSGGLYNGMVMPWLNFTIKGALWYQGENNVFQCHDAGETSQGHGGRGGGPFACGLAMNNTGYACMMKNLIKSWRTAWSKHPNTTSKDFPFGLVTLAGGTSEGHPRNMGAFRWAQTGNTGLLPNADMPNTFSAMAHDIGDPCSGGGQCCVNTKDGQGGWPCESGEAPYTGQFMGGIHPRVKKLVGIRLAKAARAHVYGDSSIVWTGPVLIGCTVAHDRITLNFNRDQLKDDTIMVLDQTSKSMSRIDSEGMIWNEALLPLIQHLSPQSPFEIQLNGGHTQNMTDGIWLPARLQPKCSPQGVDHLRPGQGGCNWNYTTSTKTPGWDEVMVPLPGTLDIANITGIRYAWGGFPCCPTINRHVIPCPPNSCPIQSFNSTMPAVPFWATIKSGKCDFISATGGSNN